MDPPMCANGCGFFGSAANQNLCSKCYKDFLLGNKEEEEEKDSGEVKDRGSSSSVTAAISRLSLSPPHTKEKDKCVAVDDTTSKAAAGATKKAAERCVRCSKKVGVVGFKCRCGSMFCSMHRLPEEHECKFDYKNLGREILRKQNPLIKADKLCRP